MCGSAELKFLKEEVEIAILVVQNFFVGQGLRPRIATDSLSLSRTELSENFPVSWIFAFVVAVFSRGLLKQFRFSLRRNTTD